MDMSSPWLCIKAGCLEERLAPRSKSGNPQGISDSKAGGLDDITRGIRADKAGTRAGG